MRSKIRSRFIPNGKSGTQAELSYFVTRKQATTQASGRFDVGRLPKLLLQAEYSTSLLAAILPLSLRLQKREREAAKVLSIETASSPFEFPRPNARRCITYFGEDFASTIDERIFAE